MATFLSFRKAFFHVAGALALAGQLAGAHAAELGEPVLQSFKGQPLVADIELTALAEPAHAVVVRMASADVYRAANTAMHPVLAGLTMSVMRREGRQFLHITSVKTVDTDHVLLFLDLVEGSKHNIRSVTLWLAPDPNPAPPPPVIAKPVVPVPVPERVAPVLVAKPAAVIVRQPPAAAACQPLLAAQAKTCAETDYKNGLLSAQIVELEEKVKALQQAAEHKTEAPAPKPAPKITPPLTVPKPAHAPEAGFPWLLVSGIVLTLALIGGGVFYFLRRRKGKSVEAAAADSVAWYTRLAARFKRKPKPILLPEEDAPKEA
ncbi:MAG: hypothetical protein V4631_01085 [Pseudomonadota bacterium]